VRKLIVELTWMLIAATLAGLGLMMLLGCPTAFGLETSEKMESWALWESCNRWYSKSSFPLVSFLP